MKRLYGLALLCSLVLGGCQKAPSQLESLPLVKVMDIKHGTLAKEISADGAVKAAESAAVTSPISGRVSSVAVKPGDQVTVGEALLWVEDPLSPSKINRLVAEVESARAALESARLNTSQSVTQQASDVEQAEAEVRSAKVAVEKANTALQSAESDLARKQDLLKKKAIAETDVEKARLQRDESRSDLENAQIQWEAKKDLLARTKQNLSVSMQRTKIEQAAAQLRQAQADLDSAQVEQSQQVLRAPITGVVVERNVQVGQDPAVSSKPLLVIDAQTALRVEAKVDERYASDLRPGIEGTGHAIALAKEPIALVIERVTPESSGALINVDFRPKEGTGPLMPAGTYVRVRLTLNNEEGALVPVSSIVWNQNGEATVVTANDRKIRKQTVDILQQDSKNALVPAEALPEGTWLVLEGGAGLKDGQEVRIEK